MVIPRSWPKAEALGPWTAWFSPTDGLRCVVGLLGALADPEVRARMAPVEMVLEDLNALEDVLVFANEKRARFRLELA